MNRESRPHVLDLSSTRSLRSPSSTSSFDYGQSTCGSAYSAGILSSLLEASPDPAFIAPAAATQIVTNNHEGFFDDQTIVSAGAPTILVTGPALRLLNQFLDYLLYSFLATAKSTSLPVLSTAVTAVLNKKLARDAILGADEELQSYLGGTEEDEADRNGHYDSESGDWDLERTWRRTRVRCMIYSSLGDLEEDDEAMYAPGDHLEGAVGSQQCNWNSDVHGVLSPAVAIWLTAILEFVGEQTLLIAGDATIARYSALCTAASAVEEISGRPPVPERPMVEELDIEKVALNPSLGRVWRQWRKKLRGTGLSMLFSPSDNMSHHWSSRPSTSRSLSGIEWTDATGAAALPLPMPAYPEQLRASPGLDSEPTSSQRGHELRGHELEKSLPDLMEDELVGGKMEEDIDAKNPLTPLWETGSNLDGPAESEVTEFEDDNTDIELWLAKYDYGRRPRSMILFPWTVSQFNLPADPMLIKRPHSLPPLDTPLEAVEPIVPEHILVDSSTDLSLVVHLPEDARSKADRIMALEQAELQKQLAADGNFRSQVLGPPDTTITGTLERGLTINTSVADDTDFESDAPAEIEEACFARASNYVKAVSPKEIQCITLTPNLGRSKRRVKGKASKSSLTESSGTGSGKTLNGPLTPVAEIQRGDREPAISDFRETIDTAMGSSDNETLPTPVARLIIFKKIIHDRSLSDPSPPRPSSSHTKRRSSSSSTRPDCIEGAPSSPSTLSERSGRMCVRTSSGGADDLRPSSSMSRIVSRPIHTSGSMASQNSHGLKSFMTWPGDSGKRSDVDDTSSLRSERLLNRSKTRDEKERSFEELIQSGGTIVCTLTPDEIRGIELPEPSSSYTAGDLAESGVETPRPASKAKSVAVKVPASLARDARVEDITASRDLALFLRSTGPPERTVSSPKATTSYSTTSNPLKASKVVGSAPFTKSSPSAGIQPASLTLTVPSVMTLQRIDTRPSTIQSNNKKRFVAREASGSTGDSTSALADFFRNTLPPIEGEDVVQHRISRSVAPFRTTIDSAQFDIADAATQKLIYEPTMEPGLTATDSYQPSMTTSTGLLNSVVKRNEELTSAKLHTLRRTPIRDGPVRTQRRVRDPYAIDDDDFDMEDDIDLITRAPARQEESLADFLRNAIPTSSGYSKFKEVNTNKKIPKKSSAVNLMTRLSRGPSRKNFISAPVPFEKPQTHRPLQPAQRSDIFDGSRPSIEPQTQPTREGIWTKPRLHTAESFCRSMDVNSIHSLVGVNGTSQRPQQSRPKPVREARGARVAQSSGMDELAAFLKDSAPPSMGPAPERRVGSREKDKEEGSGVNKFRSITSRSKRKRKEVAGMV
ncbi:hypothetical protein EV426DRAFT_427575 [Tirmania nivea]|nr:hypothetical protein EV426DRAFT_427575 [Tirmania nivea]